MDATNERVSDIIIEKFSDLLTQTEMVDNECDLKKELSKNKMFRNDLKSFVGCVTPYVPYIGLISGLITVGGFIIYKRFKTTEDPSEVTPNEEAQQPNKVRTEGTERSEAPKPAKQQPKQPRKPRKLKVMKEEKVPPNQPTQE